MAENLTPKKYIDSNNMKQILTTVKNEIPIKVSELTNDSEYQTEEQVNSTVTTEIAKAVALGDKNFSTAPIGTVLSFAGNTVPHGYLLCNGASYPTANYPDLYAVIGNTYGGDTENFNVPDYRETVLVGVGENTTDTIASHDVYELGEFKDDQLQRITGEFEVGNRNRQPHISGAFSTKGPQYEWFALSETAANSSRVEFDSSKVTRSGTTTHGKQKGVTYIIKAFHTNEGVDSGVSDDVVEYVNNSLVNKADKSYVDDNFATMDKVESKYEEATLDTPVDWNTLNTKARYYVSGGAIMTNAPMQQPFGELVVETAGDGSVCRVQKFFSFDGRLYMRRWTGSVWNDWYKFDGISI